MTDKLPSALELAQAWVRADRDLAEALLHTCLAESRIHYALETCDDYIGDARTPPDPPDHEARAIDYWNPENSEGWNPRQYAEDIATLRTFERDDLIRELRALGVI